MSGEIGKIQSSAPPLPNISITPRPKNPTSLAPKTITSYLDALDTLQPEDKSASLQKTVERLAPCCKKAATFLTDKALVATSQKAQANVDTSNRTKAENQKSTQPVLQVVQNTKVPAPPPKPLVQLTPQKNISSKPPTENHESSPKTQSPAPAPRTTASTNKPTIPTNSQVSKTFHNQATAKPPLAQMQEMLSKSLTGNHLLPSPVVHSSMSSIMKTNIPIGKPGVVQNQTPVTTTTVKVVSKPNQVSQAKLTTINQNTPKGIKDKFINFINDKIKGILSQKLGFIFKNTLFTKISALFAKIGGKQTRQPNKIMQAFSKAVQMGGHVINKTKQLFLSFAKTIKTLGFSIEEEKEIKKEKEKVRFLSKMAQKLKLKKIKKSTPEEKSLTSDTPSLLTTS